MKSIYSLCALSLLLLLASFDSFGQETSKKEKVQSEIEEIIQSIDIAVDTILHMDQIDRIYEAGSYAKLNNLIEYYSDLDGSEEEVSEYRAKSAELGKRLVQRRDDIDKGNIIDLEYQEEVETKIKEIRGQLGTANTENIRSIEKSYRRLRSIFDIVMAENTVMSDWKNSAIERMDQLKKDIDTKASSL